MYLTGCVSPVAQPHLDSGLIGFMVTPNIGNTRKPTWTWSADSGCFNRKTYKGDDNYVAWLTEQHSKDRCLFATAPDVLGDGAATVALALTWLPLIRSLGYYPALVTQDGMTPDMVPWHLLDSDGWLFLGGTNAHKLGSEAKALIIAAKARGLKVHAGRVNSGRRFESMSALGVDSVDGTFLGFGPDTNLPKLLGWIERHNTHAPLFEMETA